MKYSGIGGDIERGHAESFLRLSEQQRSEFSVVARILETLVKSYS